MGSSEPDGWGMFRAGSLAWSLLMLVVVGLAAVTSALWFGGNGDSAGSTESEAVTIAEPIPTEAAAEPDEIALAKADLPTTTTATTPTAVPPTPNVPETLPLVAGGSTLLPLVAPTPTPTPHPLDSLLAFREPVRPDSAVYLTFDDGPDPNHTPQLLDLLDEFDAQATFFVLGLTARSFPAILDDIAERGHAIGNHTWGHGDQVHQEDIAIVGSLGSTNSAVSSITGITPTCFRPPYGSMDERTAQVVWNQGFSIQLWDVDSEDYLRPDRHAIAEKVLSEVQLGDRVLFHDGGGDRTGTLAAVRDILEVLSARGVTFAAIDDCVPAG